MGGGGVYRQLLIEQNIPHDLRGNKWEISFINKIYQFFDIV